MEGNFNLQVVIQLWQVVIAVLVLSGSLIGAGFSSAIIFVRRSECQNHQANTNDEFSKVAKSLEDLYALNREIRDKVFTINGKMGNHN